MDKAKLKAALGPKLYRTLTALHPVSLPGARVDLASLSLTYTDAHEAAAAARHHHPIPPQRHSVAAEAAAAGNKLTITPAFPHAAFIVSSTMAWRSWRGALVVAWALAAGCWQSAWAATVSHDFNITWVTANPDGAFARPVIGINGKWPIPRIDADIGDRVVINVHNQLGNQSTSLHFHGLFMNGTTQMDGPSQVTQCGITPGSSFTYNFTVRIMQSPPPRVVPAPCFHHPAGADSPPRSSSRARTGTTPTTRASTRTASGALS